MGMEHPTADTAERVYVERGRITDKRKHDQFQYKVESMTRKGVTSRWMEAVGAYVNEYTEDVEDKYEYNPGDEVYCFMFPDGRGMILGKMTRDTE